MQSFNLFMRISRFIRVRWKLTGAAYLCTLLTLLCTMLQPFLFSYLIDHVLINKQIHLIYPILGISLGCIFAAAGLKVASRTLFRYLGIQYILDLRNVLLAHIRKIPITEIEKYKTGKFLSLMGTDTTTSSNFINAIFVELITLWVQITIAVAMIFYFDWRLGMIVLIGIPLVMFIPRLYRKPLSRSANHVRLHNEEIQSYLIESIQGSREIRNLGLDSWEQTRNNRMYKDLVRVSKNESLYQGLSVETGVLAIGFIIVALYLFGTEQVLSNQMTIGMLVASIQYLHSALNPIQSIHNFFGAIVRSEVAMSHIERFLHTPVEAAAFVAEQSNFNASGELASGLTCRELCVSYEGIKILSRVNFTVKPGQLAVFVGRSGAGKTTLFKTLMGFMPIESGEVYLGKVSYDFVSRRNLAEHLGMVFQDTFIFAGTLFENIALGKLDATEKEVYEAAVQANLQSFIDALPDGLHTKVDNQGFQLSGGQRQRIAIARIFLRNPQIMLFDEPTSALDLATEKEVLIALQRLMKGRMALVSTHRLETMQSADIIYVMEQGSIVDSGSHEELLQRCQTYANLIGNQGNQKIVLEANR